MCVALALQEEKDRILTKVLLITKKTMDKPWFVYLVQAKNSSLYCGISNDPIERFYKHCKGSGAKFFSISPAFALVYIEACTDKSTALKREKQIKKLTKLQKQHLIQTMQNNLYSLPIYADQPSSSKPLPRVYL